jgi:hypothetical protein
LWLGCTATAASALFLIAGIHRARLEQARWVLHRYRLDGWCDGWQVMVGLALVPVAIYRLRRCARDIDLKLGRI